MNLSLLFAMLALVTASAGQTVDERFRQYGATRQTDPLIINADEAAHEIAAGGQIAVVDVRDRGKFLTGSLPRAVSLPINELLNNPKAAGFNAVRVLVAAESGEQAVEAAVLLRLAGIKAIAVDASIRDVQSLISLGSRAEKQATVPSSPPPQQPAPQSPDPSQTWVLRMGLFLALLALAGFSFNHWVWAPRRKLRPVQNAVEILYDKETGRYEESSKLLRKGVDSGLKSGDLADARFALAFARAKLGRLDEAIAVMSDLMASTTPFKEAAYLDLWLQIRAKHYEEALRRYTEYSDILGEYKDTKLMGGIALLEQGFVAVARQDYESAVQLFKQLGELGVLKEHMPADMVDQRVAFAVESLFSSKTDDARNGFTQAADEGGPKGLSGLYARVGLALCDWRVNPTANIDTTLEDLAESATILLEKDTQRSEAPVDVSMVEGGHAKEIIAERILTPVQLLVRNVRLMYAVSMLRVWSLLPAENNLPAGQLNALSLRLAAVREIDPNMGDPWLIEGLIRYYFADSDAMRRDALRQLASSAEREVSVPEVNYLIECEKSLARLQENSMRDGVSLMKQYLEEETVPIVQRKKLQQKLGAHESFKELRDVDLKAERTPKDTSVRDVAAVSGIMYRRVERLVRPKKGDRIEGMLTEVKEGANTISQRVSDLDKLQRELMEVTAEYLLKEEGTPGKIARVEK